MAEKVKIYNRCRVCNLPLKTERAKKRGYGLKCARKLRRGFGGIQIEQFENVDRLRSKLHISKEGEKGNA